MEQNKTPQALAAMERQQLRRLLTAELQKAPDQIDGGFVRLLLAELRSRGQDPAFADDEEVEAACEKFRRDTAEHRPRKWLLRAASVILVLGILFFALPAAQADSVQGVLGWWSDSVFRVFKPGKVPAQQELTYHTDHPGLQQIHDAVVDQGITEQIVPSELSNEFELAELKTLQFLGDTTIYAGMISEDHNILYTAIIHSEKAMLQYEKTAKNVSVWDLAGIEHYVISNAKEIAITWVVDNIECTVTTDCPEEDVYRFIKSIYTSED